MPCSLTFTIRTDASVKYFVAVMSSVSVKHNNSQSFYIVYNKRESFVKRFSHTNRSKTIIWPDEDLDGYYTFGNKSLAVDHVLFLYIIFRLTFVQYSMSFFDQNLTC
jgi:hypothetical protein